MIPNKEIIFSESAAIPATKQNANSQDNLTALETSEIGRAKPPVEILTYSVTETAQALGVSLPTIYRLIARRLLRPLPGLRHMRLSKRQVLAYVNTGNLFPS